MASADASPTEAPSPGADSTATSVVSESGRVRAFYELTKPGIAGFVMMTAGVSYFVAAGGEAALLPVLHTLLGTVLATGGALALNQYLERDLDRLMFRTRRRPIPSGRVSPTEALLFGGLLLILGTGYLLGTLGWLPAALTLFSAAAYNLAYTPLKSRSYSATLVGAIPGAMPALIGWSAATGTVTLGGLVLFAIAFLWQLPHVLALAWLLREDYGRAGFYLTPPADRDGRIIARQMVLYTAALLPVSLVPTLIQLTGWIYFTGALVLGAILLVWTLQAARTMERVALRKVFLGSLGYQPVLLGFMLIDTLPRG